MRIARERVTMSPGTSAEALCVLTSEVIGALTGSGMQVRPASQPRAWPVSASAVLGIQKPPGAPRAGKPDSESPISCSVRRCSRCTGAHRSH